MTRLLLRPECAGEQALIGATHTHAFHDRQRQAAIVALHRRRPDADPDLSLVAEFEGHVVAHAFFAPCTINLGGQPVSAVNLASMAVDPVFQGRGFGVQLIEHGHTVAATKGHTLSFLVGHPGYYRRFGYRSGAFGSSWVEVPVTMLPQAALTERSMTGADVPAVRELWHREEQAVDFSIEPGEQLEAWVSPNPNIRAVVYLQHSRVVGYMRGHAMHPGRPHVFLADNPEVALAMAASIARAAGTDGPVASLSLPLHPASASATVFATPQCAAWGSALALSLGASPFDDYYAGIKAELQPPGRVLWPVEFDIE